MFNLGPVRVVMCARVVVVGLSIGLTTARVEVNRLPYGVTKVRVPLLN